MMSQQEIYGEIMALPWNTRTELLRRIERDLKGLGEKGHEAPDSRSREEIIAERKIAVDGLRGIASVPGKTPPTDEEWREERTNYLLEKYK